MPRILPPRNTLGSRCPALVLLGVLLSHFALMASPLHAGAPHHASSQIELAGAHAERLSSAAHETIDREDCAIEGATAHTLNLSFPSCMVIPGAAARPLAFSPPAKPRDPQAFLQVLLT